MYKYLIIIISIVSSSYSVNCHSYFFDYWGEYFATGDGNLAFTYDNVARVIRNKKNPGGQTIVLSFMAQGTSGWDMILAAKGYNFPAEMEDSVVCNCINNSNENIIVSGGDSSNIQHPQIDNCPGRDSMTCFIQSCDCYELGNENPDKPKIENSPAVNGKWVYLKFHKRRMNGSWCADSVLKTVISGGCSGISIDGKVLKKKNAYDTTLTEDGVHINKCSYNGTLYVGNCVSNGFDTGCGGQTPFQYGNNNDSILNNCKFNKEESIDSIKRDTMINNDDGALAGKVYAQGVNNLGGKLDTANMINSSTNTIMGKLMNMISDWSKSINFSLAQILGKIGDSTNLMVDSSGTGIDTNRMGNYDSTAKNYVPGSIDSVGIHNKLYSKLDSAKNEQDTNIVGPDTSRVSSLFAPFVVSWGDTSNCDCDSNAFHFVFMGKTQTINICKYDISVYTRPIFKLVAIILLFIFYRSYLFEVVIKSFTGV